MVMSSVVVALGSNLGDRAHNLRRALHELRACVHIVRVSAIRETAPVDAPPGSPSFLNMVVAGYSSTTPLALLDCLNDIERRLGRRRGIRNAPRTIDLDLILHSARVMRSGRLTLPHPRYLGRDFVRGPLRELRLPWRDPISGAAL
jgi:2-amino-4-hydroxy-6-hydroxymethyldihydropteridine diphosphokinase